MEKSDQIEGIAYHKLGFDAQVDLAAIYAYTRQPYGIFVIRILHTSMDVGRHVK